MTASVADRSRAARIRRKGNLAIPEERHWLSLYESSRAPAVAVARYAPAPAPAPAPPTPAPPGASPAPEAPERHLRLVPPPPATPATPGHVNIDFGASLSAPTAKHSAACAIPDCPRCRAVAGALVCQSTGESVWPRMSEDGARGMAGAIMGAIALVARMLGKDVTPLPEEVERLARALRETIYQRAGALGAGDDLYALGWLVLLFGVRVYQAPKLAR